MQKELLNSEKICIYSEAVPFRKYASRETVTLKKYASREIVPFVKDFS
jgi:hypothetical protein